VILDSIDTCEARTNDGQRLVGMPERKSTHATSPGMPMGSDRRCLALLRSAKAVDWHKAAQVAGTSSHELSRRRAEDLVSVRSRGRIGA
jgi:hypothetical protein